MIVVNNQGGGIFRFLPVSQEEDCFEAFFVTPHSFCLAGAGEPFKLDTFRVGSKDQFDQAYRSALQAERSALIEVSVDGEKSFQFRKGLKAAILERFK
jgi:2-succinyl-5-enolpyruvyl-6-hydroxy-3-cyclohexene-1-carboxylate synthase